MKIGYALSSEEHPAPLLVAAAIRAEAVGFDFLSLSDHFAPWTEAQGNSPFSWSVIGALSQATRRIQVLMGVVCPIMRYHPAIVAQAAATSASLLEGRFALGLGTGEALNEHVVGRGWPHIATRREMLAEAVGLIRRLWSGEDVSHTGRYFQLEAAKIYSLPHRLPPIIISGFGPQAARLAGRLGDGFVSIVPDRELVRTFETAGEPGRPKYAQIQVCYAPTVAEAKRTTSEYWPNGGLNGPLSQELRLPHYFEQATSSLTEDQVTVNVALGSDPATFIRAIRDYEAAGYDHISLHQIGPDQDGFFDFCVRELFPALEQLNEQNSTTDALRKLAFREQIQDDDTF